MKIDLEKIVCRRCGHAWIPRKTEVRICPKCKSRHFDKPRKKKEAKP